MSMRRRNTSSSGASGPTISVPGRSRLLRYQEQKSSQEAVEDEEDLDIPALDQVEERDTEEKMNEEGELDESKVADSSYASLLNGVSYYHLSSLLESRKTENKQAQSACQQLASAIDTLMYDIADETTADDNSNNNSHTLNGLDDLWLNCQSARQLLVSQYSALQYGADVLERGDTQVDMDWANIMKTQREKYEEEHTEQIQRDKDKKIQERKNKLEAIINKHRQRQSEAEEEGEGEGKREAADEQEGKDDREEKEADADNEVILPLSQHQSSQEDEAEVSVKIEGRRRGRSRAAH